MINGNESLWCLFLVISKRVYADCGSVRVVKFAIAYLSRETNSKVYHHSPRKLNVYAIGHVRYINMLTWLRGFRVKIANF